MLLYKKPKRKVCRFPGLYIKLEFRLRKYLSSQCPKLYQCPGNCLWAFILDVSISDPPLPNTSAYTVILCVLLVPQCASFYISINICRRPPNTSLLLMAAQAKKRFYQTPLLYTSSLTHTDFLYFPVHTHTHWPLMSVCVCNCFHLNEELSGDLWHILKQKCTWSPSWWCRV